MAARRILHEGDAALLKKCHPVTRFDAGLHALLDDMHETLEKANGCGLAAPQVGILRRACLITSSDDTVVELINPTILTEEGLQEGWEGCLSIPGMYGWVARPETVRVRAVDRTGSAFELEESGFAARCVCHELDHLDGKLYPALAGRLYTAEEVDALLQQQAETRQGEETP